MKKSQNQLIKDHIEKLHLKGKSDFQSLLKQVEERQQKIQLNLPQMVAALARQPILVLEWGRGTGKTTILGWRIAQICQQMPRSTGLFIGPTYQAILTRIIPSLIQGLEMLGIYEGLHYFIGRLPPPSWRKYWGKAFQPPKKYNNYITFWNGVGMHLISQDVAGDGRGLNSDWIIGDEAGLLSFEKLEQDTDPTLRGSNTNAFKKQVLFGSTMYCSSTPLTPEGQWFVDMEEKALQTPEKIVFISATCEHNRHNLRKGYLDDALLKSIAEWIFNAEYLNIRPQFNSDSFYGLLDQRIHCYETQDNGHYTTINQKIDCRGDADLVKGQPLIVGVDWGAEINCLVTGQHIKSLNEFRALKSMYVLGIDKKIQDDLFNNFCDYYEYHNEKRIELWFDNSGNNRMGNSRKTRAEQARDLLIKRGWQVNLMTVGGSNPAHDLKHLLYINLLKDDHPLLPRFRMNKHNCRDLRLSMRNSKTLQGSRGEIKKDKSIEKSKKIPRQNATDLSDALDAILFGRYYRLLKFGQGFLPDVRITH